MTTSPSSPAPLCRFVSVCKWYGPVIGLNDVTFDIRPGITGLVGHNGAGKSTLIKLLTGQLRPSLGRVEIRGQRAWTTAAKRHLGYCPDLDAMYEEMSGRAFARTMARLHGFSPAAARRRVDEVLAQVGMADRADRPLGTYSKGMRQRIKLAQALVHDPELLVLDEPLNGVDPVGRVEMLQLFRDLAARGKALLVSSHILDEMDTLADQILFICRGRLIAAGTLAEIRAMLDAFPLTLRITTRDARRLATLLLPLDMVRSVEVRSSEELLLQVERAHEFFGPLAGMVAEQGFDLERLQILDASTEAVFEYLMRAVTHAW
ncbi:MAG: ABC transporter ATP-binding protein [Pirellulales bacterium]